MKVLYIVNTTGMGGGNISFINLIQGMSSRGVEVYIVHPDKNIDSDFLARTKEYVKEYYYVPLHPQVMNHGSSFLGRCKRVIKRLLRYDAVLLKFEIRKVKRVVKKIQPNLIHTNVGVIHSGYYSAKKLGIPHVWHVREYQDKDFNWIILPSKEKFISYLNNTYVITITRDLLKYFRLENSPKATCIYNGCFSKAEVALDMPKEKYFLCCSRVSPEKGHDEVIKAFSEFRKEYPDYKLIIAGFGPSNYIDKLKGLAESLGCSEGVSFVGYYDDVRPLMDKASALIVASRFEGFGRMTAEAAFRGCLVIGRNTGGTREILEQIEGYPFEKGVGEIIEKMRNIAELSNEDYQMKARQSQEIACRLFSNEQYVDAVYNVYQTLW